MWDSCSNSSSKLLQQQHQQKLAAAATKFTEKYLKKQLHFFD
jgi:hypothetical protein